MIVLGINGGFRQGYQDVSACLVEDGRVVAAIEEERLNRIKFSGGRLPYLSVIEVLKIAGRKIQDVDIVAFHGSTWGAEIDQRITDYFKFHFGYAPPLQRYHHHDCHAASAYYASGFDNALIITMDNSGDGISTQICTGENGQIKLVERFDRANSLGFFYSLVTQFCGFAKDSDEYKVMGLSSYGNRKKYDFDWLISFANGQLRMNQEFINSVAPKAPALHKDDMNFNAAFLRKTGAGCRIPKSDISQYYKDIAASAQQHLEDTVLSMIQHYVGKTGKTKICLAGGVALNCVLNQKIMNAGFVDEIFIQPAAGDAGISLGAAWLAGREQGINPVASENTFLGNQFSNDEVREVFYNCRLKYSELNDPAEIAAEFILQDKVIGWFQGRTEFGPRALGARSILANPANAEMKNKVNAKIKFRESFRPFCPGVLEEDATQYFSGKQKVAPYMTVTYDVVEKMRSVIPAVSHVDGTARIQTVNQSQNAKYYSLLQALKAKSGNGVVLNTSFNLSHEPIVATPRDAVASFYASGMDALIIENFLIEK
ncbi:MAG: carbamoyl transferase [Bacteroidota bacterium]|nr:carbamoyl transferase [Bacteroidota bacterium]